MIVTLLVGVITAGATLGSSNMSTTTRQLPDIRSCTEALQQELEAARKPGVVSVTGTCTVLNPK